MYRRRYAPYYSTRYNTLRSQGYGTRYRSTRPITGLYRSSARYVLTGRARRLFGGRGVKAIVRSMAEHKYKDTALKYGPVANSATWIDNNGTMYNVVTDIAQGAGDSQRIGDKITITSLQVVIHCSVPFPKSGTIVAIDPRPDYIWRFIAFIWKDDTQPLPGDIVQDQFIGTDLFVLAPLNHDKRVKRKILYDKTFAMFADVVGGALSSTYAGTTNGNMNIKIFVPFKKLGKLATINFQNAGINGVNKIYFLMISNAVPVGLTPPITDESWSTWIYPRVNYIDM